MEALSYHEPVVPRRLQARHRNFFDLRERRRALVQLAHEPLDFGALALHLNQHSRRRIEHVPGKPQLPGQVVNERTKPDALDDTTDADLLANRIQVYKLSDASRRTVPERQPALRPVTWRARQSPRARENSPSASQQFAARRHPQMPKPLAIVQPAMDTTQQQFDQAYWASQPPEIQALPGIADPDQRTSRGAELATKGFTIDVPIMVWAWDAYLVMTMREQYGYTWVPSALQPPIRIAPGLMQQGVVPYDPEHPPLGSIKVSTNIPDYPPFAPPAPLAPPTAANEDPVGFQSIGNIYLSVPGDTYQDGAKFTGTRGAFLKHMVVTPFGRNAYWEKIA